MERFIGIFNPAAGGGRGTKLLPSVIDRLRRGGIELDLRRTSGPGNATEIVRNGYARGERRFIAMGGDGTSHEVVNGFFPLASDRPEDRPTLGFLPMGTGNSFLRDFTTEGLDYAIEAMISRKNRPVDIMQVRHRDGTLYFINIFSFGFVSDVGATRNRSFPGFGEAGYVLSVLKEIAGLRAHHFPLRIDNRDDLTGPVTFISINNSKFTGGKMMMAPDADTSDGKADLIHVRAMGRLALLRAFPRIFKGTHINMPQISSRKVDSVDFKFNELIDVMVDGEMVRIAPERLEVLRGAIEARA